MLKDSTERKQRNMLSRNWPILIVISGGIGYILKRFIIDPLLEFLKIEKDVVRDLMLYANIYCNPGEGTKENIDKTSDILRKLASDFSANARAIKMYRLFVFFRLIPKKTMITEISGRLIRLSNSVHSGDCVSNRTDRDKILESLNKSLRIKKRKNE